MSEATLGDVVAVTVVERRRPRVVQAAVLVVVLVLALAPFVLDDFWLSIGFAVAAAAVGAIGLNLLTGTAGQLSLAHAFFAAIGAVTYCYVAGTAGGTATKVEGLGLDPLIAAVLGVLLAGLAGLLFSPIAARLRGIYLGIASLGLVFIGQHLLNTWTSVTGGFNGRNAPTFGLLGFSFNDNEQYLALGGTPINQSARLWYLGLICTAGAAWFASNILRGRPGRALRTVRDSEIAAAVMGVNVTGYKARAFLVSSMYAGLAGVMLALSIGSVAPESFDLTLSVEFLAMIVLGGLGSVTGAVLGATFVSALPLLFQKYASSLPLVAAPGQGGIQPGQAAAILYGVAIVVVVMFEPGGIVGFAQRLGRLGRRRGGRPSRDRKASTTPTTTTRPADAGENS